MIRNTFGSKQLQCDAVSAGNRAYVSLIEGRSNRYVVLTITAILTISVAVTSIVGLGSVVQLFDYIGLDMGGRDVQVDARHWITISDYLSASKRTSTRVTSLSASPVTLIEQVYIPFEYLHGGNPGETRFRENDIKLRTKAFYTLNNVNNGIANLVGGGTAAITAVTVTAEQYFDDDKTMHPPLYRPWWKTLTLPVGASNTEAYVDLDLKDLCRGISIIQNTDKGMVSDIIKGIGLRGASTNYLGSGLMLTLDEFARQLEFKSGGDVYVSATGGALHINLQESGRLSHCLNPTQDSNFRLYFNVATSLKAGITKSEVLILLHLLERKALQRDDGQWVTAPDPMMPQRLVA